MTPKHQNRRLTIFALCALAVMAGSFLLLQALGDNKQLFVNPSNVVAPAYIQGANPIKVGGMVVEDSVQKGEGLITYFSVVDFENPDPQIPELKVIYDDVLPDLFKEGEGVVMTGKLGQDGVFIASNVLAKHDENYMPKLPDS